MITPVRNSRGNVMLQILAATAAMGISFYFLTNYVIGQKKQISKTVNAVSLRFALNSTMDYVIFGVRQKYCFTPDVLANDSKCDLSHDGSVERLIMSTDQKNFIKMMHAPVDGSKGVDFPGADYNNLGLNKIIRYLKISSLAAGHPLLSVMLKLKTVKDEITGQVVAVDGLKVEIFRDNSLYLPKAGREVYLRINLSLVDANKNVITVGKSALNLSSSVAIYPREVGSFALLVARDLHLDMPSDGTAETGDVIFHQFDSRQAVGGPGLTFLSPIFVNEDIYLPEVSTDDKATADTSKYAAVTFADRVVMGNGWIKTVSGKYEPRTAGAVKDRMWSDAINFGGFLKGIENDGALDSGLLVFGRVSKLASGAAVAPGVAPDTSLQKECTDLNLKKVDAQSYEKLSLGATLKKNSSSATKSSFAYRMFFDGMNSFNPQKITAGVTQNSWGTGTIKYDQDKWYTNVIFEVNVEFGKNKSATIKMPFESNVTLKPEIGSPQQLEKLQTNYNTAKTLAERAQVDLDALGSTLKTYNMQLAQKKNELSNEESKPELPVAVLPSPNPAATPNNKDVVVEASPSPTATPIVTPAASPSAPPLEYGDKRKFRDADKIVDLKMQISKLETKITHFKNADIYNQEQVLSTSQRKTDDEMKRLNDYRSLVSVQPEIYIYIDRIKSNQADIYVDVKNVNHLVTEDGTLGTPTVRLKAYDETYWKGMPVNGKENTKLAGYLNFKFNTDQTKLTAPLALSPTKSSEAMNLNADENDYDDLAQRCEAARNAATSQSFGGASWDINFSAGTRHSWNFAGDSAVGHDPANDYELRFTGTRASPPAFGVKSIVKKCVVDKNATIVTGFYACDEMVIEGKRALPLRIIGSFIVGKLFVDPSAYTAGITWSSIYHPQATRELRALGILKPSGLASCEMGSTTSPIWHPIPSVQELANRLSCNAISLRAKADPFRWTSVDPDCGMATDGATQSNTTCKRRLVRFYVVEQSREEGLDPAELAKVSAQLSEE